jgi:AbrB family looped-hinge helix DNA binding protein
LVSSKLYFLEVKVSALGKISSKNQITVPKEVRERLGIQPGDIIAYDIEDERVILRRVEPFDREFHEALAKTLNEWSTSEDAEAFRDL